jgi:hypothetical protein
LAVGSLPGQQVGGVWIVEWRADDDGTAPVLVRGAAASAGRVDESREVTGG